MKNKTFKDEELVQILPKQHIIVFFFWEHRSMHLNLVQKVTVLIIWIPSSRAPSIKGVW